MVVPHHLLHVRTGDVEERQPPAVRASDLDADQLAAAFEPERREEEILCLEHPAPPLPAAVAAEDHDPWTAEERSVKVEPIAGEPKLSSDLGPASGTPDKSDPVPTRLRRLSRKPVKALCA